MSKPPKTPLKAIPKFANERPSGLLGVPRLYRSIGLDPGPERRPAQSQTHDEDNFVAIALRTCWMPSAGGDARDVPYQSLIVAWLVAEKARNH